MNDLNSTRGQNIREEMRKAGVLAGRLDWPALLYTAVGMRGILPPLPQSSESVAVPQSHAHLSIGYYNVMLPTNDFPSTSAKAQHERSAWFWNQARETRRQGEAAVKHPNFIARTVEHGKERCLRAKTFAKMDDARLGIVPSKLSPVVQAAPRPTVSQAQTPAPAPAPAPAPPSVALIGLSLLGSLDRVYSPNAFPSLRLLTSASGTRKGPGGILVFSHSLAGRLYVHVGWDKEGFEEGMVEEFADGVVACVREFALDETVDSERLTARL